MGKTAESQSCSSLCFFKPSLLCFAVFVLSLVFICFLAFGFPPLLVTISLLFLSTIFIVKFSMKRAVIVENPAQDESFICSTRSVLEKEVGEKLNSESEATTKCNPSQRSEVYHMDEYQVESTDFPSESESSDDLSASENFELNWLCSGNVGQNVALRESSVSDDGEDDDNLIEISLPESSSADLDDGSKEKLQSNLPDYLLESIVRQQELMELLAEINEVNDENLIEIDLSVGSIK